MQMKNIYTKCFIAAALTLLMSACVQEDLQKGDPEREDCMGVYFVADQANAKDHTLERGDKTELEFKVRRSDVSKGVQIPYEYTVYRLVRKADSDTTYVEEPVYDDSKFEFGRLQFLAGQKESTIKVKFDKINTCVRYRCAISISDPEYVPVYGYSSSSVTFSVQINEWVKTDGKAIYRDALFSDMFDWKGKHLETEVEVEHRKDNDKYLRLKNVYSAEFLARLVEGDEEYEKNSNALKNNYAAYVDENAYIYVDATDSSKVYFPNQKTGFSDGSLGDIYVASDVEEVFSGMSNYLYGTLSKDGVITFPENGILMGVNGLYYFSNSSGKARIVLPGGKAEDYGIEVKAEECTSGGKLPVTFKVAKDVKTIKYRLFKGKVSGLALTDAINQTSKSGIEIPVSEELEIKKDINPEGENPETDLYTLVACTFADGETDYSEYTTLHVGYVAPGDERKVQIFMGLHTDDMLASDKEESNYSSENSFQYWVRGKDITHAQISYYPTAYYKTYEKQIKKSLISYGSVNGQVLKQLNGSGLSGILGNKFKAGTEYTFVVYAGNGYHSEFFTKSITLAGEPDLMKKSYYLTDLQEYEQPGAEAFAGTWVPVSTDIFGNGSEGRVIRGNWKSQEVEITIDGDEAKVAGLFPSLKTNPTIRFDLKEGLLYSKENTCAKVWVKDSTNIVPSMRFEYQYIPKTGAFSENGYFYDKFDDDSAKDRRDMFVGGFVHEDIIAFVDNGTENVFWAMALGGYQKSSMGEDVLQNYIGDAHGELILVRKESDLWKGLKYAASTGKEEGVVLNSLSEANRIELPKPGSLINADLKDADTAHKLLEFKSGVRIKTTMK